MAWLMGETSPDAYDLIREEAGAISRFAYRLRETTDDERVAALYAFTVADDAHVQLAVYFDDERDCALALDMWRSVRLAPRKPHQE